MLDLIAMVFIANEPLEVVQVTGSRIEQSTFESNTAIAVVDKEAMDVRAPQIAVDALRGVPGVFVQQTTPGQGIPIVRGLKGSEVLHLVDGVRLNNSFFRNAPNQYIALVESASVDRAEVLRGPASTLYGADALGGVVQFLTTKPQYGMHETRIHGGFGTGDENYRLGVDANFGFEDGAVLIQANYLDVGDRKTGAGDELPTSYQSRSLRAVGIHAFGAHELMLDLQHLEQPSTPRVDELVPGFGQAEAESAEFYFEPNERTFGHIRLTGDVELPFADSYDVHVSWQRLVDDRRSRNAGSEERRLEHNQSDQLGLSFQASLQWGQFGTLVYGADAYFDEVESDRRGVSIVDGSSRPLTSRFPTGSEQSSAAAFVRNEWSFERLGVSAGLRYSSFDIDIAQADREAAGAIDLSEQTATLGLTYRIHDDVNLVANYGEGFRAPNIFDLSTLGERPGNRFNIANNNLGPEQLESVDAGIKWSGQSTEAELFVFEADFTDKITSVPTGDLTPSGRVIVQSENVGRVELRGLEAGVRHRPSEGLELSATFNYVRGTEIQQDGSQTDGDRIPPANLALGASWQARENLGLGAELRMARRQDRLSDRDRRDSRINPDGTAGWGTLAVWADYRPLEPLRLIGGIDNVFDKAYREHGSGLDAVGRNVRLSVEYVWR